MDENIIMKIIPGIYLSIGSAVLFLLAYLLFYKYLIQEKKCTAKTKGVVKRYSIGNRGGNANIHLPIVCYEVEGKEYKVMGPEYSYYKVVTKMNPKANINTEAGYRETEKQGLEIMQKRNAFVSFSTNVIAEMYPINTEIDVYYNPQNPKLAYVLRYCNRKWAFWLTFCAGLITLSLDILILVLL